MTNKPKFGEPKYPLATMKVGDAFFTEASGLRTAACMFGKRNGKKFSVRKANQNGVWGNECRRLA